ncbi:YihY/virulence factor BrkB family protein [Pedobacter sp. Leaf132]|uniref:YihY/virulence factor BrkB family protein n=1 Tax=Pedobacter sp. Leaf132 TaxID=2876557 RepID=UPI001E58E25A|nr:YihY/virulence factor BrkB family protein [Pedobacter sp. Leaf132]
MSVQQINRRIMDIDKLEAEIDVLNRSIEASNLEIIIQAKNLLNNIPGGLSDAISKSPVESKLDSTSDIGGKFVPEIVSELLGKTAFKKTGFIKRFLLKKASKLAMAKLTKPGKTIKKHKNLNALMQPLKIEQTQSDSWIGDFEQEEKAEESVHQKLNFKGILGVLKAAFGGFSDHKVTKLSGSLAYYTVFSMAPLMVVVIALMSIFLSREAAEGQVYLQLKGFLGAAAAKQVQDLIKNAAISGNGTIAFTIGIITLLLGATSVFADIQDSINSIWGIKPKPKRGWLKLLQNRFLSFSVIISLGFLLLVSLGISALLDGFSSRLQAQFSQISVVVFYILNLALNFVVISSIFAVIFKVLPDANIRWRDVMWGAIVTAMLFMLGKVGISVYISKTDVGGAFGATGSLVVLLVWTYYSSIILYFGAEFTKAYALVYGAEIHPDSHAVSIKEIEVEQGQQSLQAVHGHKSAKKK